MKNWFIAGSSSSRTVTVRSQSENYLAFSDDFSEKDEILNEPPSKSKSQNDKITLSSSSEGSLPSSSSSASPFNSQNHHFKETMGAYPKLSWQRRYLLLPSYTLIFMAVLPFIQGCLYTVGYRVGKRVLKIVINSSKYEN